MELLNEFVVVLHLLGMAAIVGGWLAVRTNPRVIPPILWGARAQLVTGLILAGLAEADKEDPPIHAKLGVKLLVALVVLALVEMANARQRRAAGAGAGTGAGTGTGAGGSVNTVAARVDAGVGTWVNAAAYLAILNVAIAALWQSYS